ncbi:bifunctional 3-(3-hydroxy-phenyl)propionate/3-hydroxycinnamic acid hydroxylase [Patulibacter sp. SYSU D01012]|uniref:bifunctional 3-(3-hydroxy-phenyl)propionate/3-hydroxycinnamic acid hydroxylase n=1 Tax=Patulibacter sp. SYSU D01012 TaxID=2817381 RepID=UPI001B305635|nr:bifunctional 3-(3-hydroxy-phenyl)propionate/3-hydroxycinnamic acid hydroxylase [Patulibacter sp. SYSU D01012]
MQADVLICGLGPVGQLLALLLGDLGVSTVAVDQADGPYDLPRAAVVDDEVLRIFQAVGLDDAVLADAQVQRTVSFVTAGGRVVEALRPVHGDLGHPPLVSIHQPSIERTMVRALASRGTVRLRWGRRLETLDHDAHGVTAWVRAVGGGPTERIRARFLVGCDGGRSGVRARVAVPFGGSTFEQRWLVLDARVDRPIARAPHPHFVGDPARPVVTLPMSPGRHRWEWMLHPGEDAAAFVAPERIGALLSPWTTGERVDVERAVVYTFHARTAARWRVGRVLLAGDAAHVMPPFVGQGFSSGARDAANLAWKLDAVLHGAPERLLDSYEAERRPHVTSMQRLAVRWGGVVQTTAPRAARGRDATLELLDRTGVRAWISAQAKPRPTYAAGAFARTPDRLPFRRHVGALFPQPGRLDDRLGRGWAVAASTPAAAAWWRAAGLHAVEAPHAREWSLLRPDRFVFACADGEGPRRRAPRARPGAACADGGRAAAERTAALRVLRATVGDGLRTAAPTRQAVAA